TFRPKLYERELTRFRFFDGLLLLRSSTPFFTWNRSFFKQFGLLRTSEGLNSSPLKINQTLEVVAGRHHGHGKIRPCLTDSSNQFAAHLFNAGKYVLDSGTYFSNALVPLFLPSRKGMVARTLALDVVAVSRLFQLRFPRSTRIAFIGIDFPAGVGRVQYGVKVLAVMGACCVGLDLADHLVASVYVH